MKEVILNKLCDIEKEYDVKVLFAVESGSRAWGFASKDSDWDVRFVYVHPLKWYMGIEEGRDVIERMYEDKNIDISGWDLRKALKLLRRSNPSFYEWIGSQTVYCADALFLEKLNEVKDQYFDVASAFRHYYHIGIKHNDRYIVKQGYVLKRFLYYLRSMLACEWIVRYSTPPAVNFRELVAATVTDTAVLGAIDRMLALKQESQEHNKEIIEDLLVDYSQSLREKQTMMLDDEYFIKEYHSADELDALFLETVLLNS